MFTSSTTNYILLYLSAKIWLHISYFIATDDILEQLIVILFWKSYVF